MLNEVLYDPTGADAGHEFVEILNVGPQTAVLDGFRIEFANGADPLPAWAVRWRGAAGDTIVAGGRFLVADTGWNGPPDPDARASLALQNGPDAVRLVGPGVEDRLAYGGAGAAGLAEGAPHPGAATGSSLARRPDGRDTDDNAADWTSSDPTPGSANFPARAARVEVAAADPPSLPVAGGEVVVELRLLNLGLEALPAGRIDLLALDAPHPGPAGAAADTVPLWLDAVEPEGARTLRATWRPLREGRRRLRLRLPADACGPALDLPVADYQVGPAGPYLSEVMPAPSAGACEWVEIGNAGPVPVDAGSLRLRDEDGGWRALPARTLEPGAFLVVAADRDRLLSWWAAALSGGAPAACDGQALRSAAVEGAGGWPSLNNSAPRTRDFADRLSLGDTAGVVLDHVTLGAGGAPLPVGRSLERAHARPRGDPARNWGVSPAPGGASPACANALSLTLAAAGATDLAPNPFAPAAGGVLHVQFALGAGEVGWDARVFDLWGRRVRDLGGDGLGEGPRDVMWDGRDDDGVVVAPGGYVVCVRRRDGAGRFLAVARRLAVVSAEATP